MMNQGCVSPSWCSPERAMPLEDKPAAPVEVVLSATDVGDGQVELRLDATPRRGVAIERLVLELGATHRSVDAPAVGVTQHLVARASATEARGIVRMHFRGGGVATVTKSLVANVNANANAPRSPAPNVPRRVVRLSRTIGDVAEVAP
jgi:hypothetical protein